MYVEKDFDEEFGYQDCEKQAKVINKDRFRGNISREQILEDAAEIESDYD